MGRGFIFQNSNWCQHLRPNVIEIGRGLTSLHYIPLLATPSLSYVSRSLQILFLEKKIVLRLTYFLTMEEREIKTFAGLQRLLACRRPLPKQTPVHGSFLDARFVLRL